MCASKPKPRGLATKLTPQWAWAIHSVPSTIKALRVSQESIDPFDLGEGGGGGGGGGGGLSFEIIICLFS